MRINGKKINPDNLDEVIGALSALPTGFTTRNINVTTVSYKHDEALKHNQDGMAAYTEWQQNKKPALLETAATHFQRAAEISTSADDQPARAQNSANYGHMQILLNKPDLAIPAFETAVKVYEQEQQMDQLYHALGGLHKAILATSQAKLTAGHSADADQLRSRLRPLRQRSSEMFSTYKGEGYDGEAYRVEQAEIGFSADRKIGTDNVNDCVCVIIRDPTTKKTALAHVDAATDVSSLEQVFSRLPKRRPPDAPLEAKLIGARFGPSSGSVYGERVSRGNIEKISRLLDKHHVEVLSAAVLDPNQPTSIVVDPLPFEVEEHSPGMPNPSKDMANGRACIEAWGKPLQVAFDLTVSDQRASILLSRQAVANLRHSYAGKNEWEIYEQFSRGHQYSDSQLPVAVEQTVALTEAYQASVDQLQETLNRKIAALEETGIKVPEYEKQKAVSAINQCPIHIGERAENSNRPLAEFIENELFRVEGKTLTTRIEGLQSFEFPSQQPYEAIEREHTQSSFQARHANSSRNPLEKGAANVNSRY